MNAQHTPGPWTAREAHSGIFDVFDPRERDVVTVYGGGVESESREANARLIAAAPDMLAALRLAFNVLDRNGEGWDEAPALEAIRAAIAKASPSPSTGETP